MMSKMSWRELDVLNSRRSGQQQQQQVDVEK